ncbi:MAG: tetratricopeptide repeat protein, partial [Armatimonadota bacterium]
AEARAMDSPLFQTADSVVPKSLLLGIYGFVVAFFLLRVVNVYLDGALSGPACVIICTIMTSVFILFAAVHLQPFSWWGADDPLLRTVSLFLVVVVALMPSFVGMLRRGTDRQIVKGRDQDAIERAFRDLSINPSNPAPHMILADIYERQRKMAEAVAHLEAAVQKAPFLAQARSRLNKLKAKL